MSSRARVIGNQNLTIGTVELGDYFGQVASGTMTHLVDDDKVPDAFDNAQALIQNNERKEFSMETVWDTTAPDPIMGDSLVLPSGETAIINKAEWKWTAGKSKGFSIDATWHMSLGNDPIKSYVTLNP